MMARLRATLWLDVRVQFRNGFYYVSVLVVAIFAGLLRLLPEEAGLDMRLMMSALVALNLILTAFYFVGGLVLLEKSENTLVGLVVSPLRDTEYLAARVLSLTGLALVEGLAVVLLAYGTDFQPLLLLLGVGLLGGLFVTVGFVAIARYHSVNEYLLPSTLLVTILILPLLDLTGLWQSDIFYLHPTYPGLRLIHAAFEPATGGQLLYALVGAVGWFALGFHQARRAFHRFVVRS